MLLGFIFLQVSFAVHALPMSYEVWLGEQGGVTGSSFRVFKESDVTAIVPRNVFTEYEANNMVPGVAAATGAAFSRLHGITPGFSVFFSLILVENVAIGRSHEAKAKSLSARCWCKVFRI